MRLAVMVPLVVALAIGCDSYTLKADKPQRFTEVRWDDTDADRDGRTGPYVADGVSQTYWVERHEGAAGHE